MNTARTADLELFDLQLRVARRADELAKTVPHHRDHSVECWLRAEREVLALNGVVRGPTSSALGTTRATILAAPIAPGSEGQRRVELRHVPA